MTTARRNMRSGTCTTLVAMAFTIMLAVPTTATAGTRSSSGANQSTVLAPLTAHEMATISGGQDWQTIFVLVEAAAAVLTPVATTILTNAGTSTTVVTVIEASEPWLLALSAWNLSGAILEATVPQLSQNIFYALGGQILLDRIQSGVADYDANNPSATFGFRSVVDEMYANWYCGSFGCMCDDYHPDYPCDEEWTCNETGFCDETIIIVP